VTANYITLLNGVRVDLYGDYFKYITGNGLYLSSTNSTFNLSSYNFYSNIRLVSSANPPFNGTPVQEFSIVSDSQVTFYLPENLPPGKYDVIYCNPAGYTKASKSKRFKLITVV